MFINVCQAKLEQTPMLAAGLLDTISKIISFFQAHIMQGQISCLHSPTCHLLK
jgi:hypothetical protein